MSTGTGDRIDNPFVQVYNALWEMAERNLDLMDLIRPKNRIKYNETIGPKTAISDGDVPELELLQMSAEGQFHVSSSSAQMTRTYSWMLTTAEYNIDIYNEVAWELYRSMVDWDVVLCALTWPDDDWHFVTKANLMSAEEGTLRRKANRNVHGWVGLWSHEVEMHFRTLDLRIT